MGASKRDLPTSPQLGAKDPCLQQSTVGQMADGPIPSEHVKSQQCTRSVSAGIGASPTGDGVKQVLSGGEQEALRSQRLYDRGPDLQAVPSPPYYALSSLHLSE